MFKPSKLGTLDYWNHIYEIEVENFDQNGDQGEVWFGEMVEEKMIEWIESKEIPFDVSILDVGTGNGHLLFELHELGYKNLTGVDYSSKSIELASKIAQNRDMADITFKKLDVLAGIKENLNSFGLILDKGTFDAICLMNPLDMGFNSLQEIQDLYISNIAYLLIKDGKFLITSCNWTNDELLNLFSSHFELHSSVPYPTFKFGGQTGQTVVTLAFCLK